MIFLLETSYVSAKSLSILFNRTKIPSLVRYESPPHMQSGSLNRNDQIGYKKVTTCYYLPGRLAGPPLWMPKKGLEGLEGSDKAETWPFRSSSLNLGNLGIFGHHYVLMLLVGVPKGTKFIISYSSRSGRKKGEKFSCFF